MLLYFVVLIQYEYSLVYVQLCFTYHPESQQVTLSTWYPSILDHLVTHIPEYYTDQHIHHLDLLFCQLERLILSVSIMKDITSSHLFQINTIIVRLVSLFSNSSVRSEQLWSIRQQMRQLSAHQMKPSQ